jgi:hypothetical protein
MSKSGFKKIKMPKGVKNVYEKKHGYNFLPSEVQLYGYSDMKRGRKL